VRTKFDKKKTEIRACPNEASCLPMVVFFSEHLTFYCTESYNLCKTSILQLRNTLHVMLNNNITLPLYCVLLCVRKSPPLYTGGVGLGLRCSTTLTTIFQLYCGSHIYLLMEKTTNLPPIPLIVCVLLVTGIYSTT
jgi:hypothetical protein